MDAKSVKDETNATTKLVKFNVGGQLFEISRDIVMRHPDTMLAKSVSDTWLTDPTSTVFINGDGDRFRCILDYLRSGSMILPIGLPKAAILKDMSYFGFENVNPDDIDASHANFEAIAHVFEKQSECHKNAREIDAKMNSFKKDFDDKMNALKRDFDDKMNALRRERTYRLVAHEGYKIYGTRGNCTDILIGAFEPGVSNDELKHAFDTEFNAAEFNKSLAEYGFFLHKCSCSFKKYIFTFGILSKRP